MSSVDEELAELRRTVQQLVDQTAIGRVVYRYCEFVDANQPDDIVSLFTDDARFDYGYGRIFTGHDELRKMFGGLDGNEATSHHLSNVVVDFIDSDTARCHSSVYAYHRRRESGHLMHLWGRYEDVLVRRAEPDGRGDTWALQQRALRAAAEEGVEPVAGLPTRWELIGRAGRDATPLRS
jgi:ketosteroid isomerase-like protein